MQEFIRIPSDTIKARCPCRRLSEREEVLKHHLRELGEPGWERNSAVACTSCGRDPTFWPRVTRHYIGNIKRLSPLIHGQGSTTAPTKDMTQRFCSRKKSQTLPRKKKRSENTFCKYMKEMVYWLPLIISYPFVRRSQFHRNDLWLQKTSNKREMQMRNKYADAGHKLQLKPHVFKYFFAFTVGEDYKEIWYQGWLKCGETLILINIFLECDLWGSWRPLRHSVSRVRT